jgi:undecaprenyl-diphosphatase
VSAAEELVDVAPPARGAPDWVPWLGAAGALGAACVVTLSLRTGGYAWPLDRSVHDWVILHRGPVDLAVAAGVTWLGATAVAVPAVAAVGALAHRGPGGWHRAAAGLLLVASAALGIWTGLVINQAVGRERPPVGDWWGTAGGASFPSGHTTAATIAAGTVAWALTSRVRSRRGRIAVWATAAAVAVLVGGSRVWLGVHWPSDVLSGWLLGASWVALVVSGAAVVERRTSRRPARSDDGA